MKQLRKIDTSTYIALLAILIATILVFIPTPYGFSLDYDTYLSVSLSNHSSFGGIVPPFIGYYIKFFSLIFGNINVALNFASALLVAGQIYSLKMILDVLFSKNKSLILILTLGVCSAIFLSARVDYEETTKVLWLLSILFYLRLIKTGNKNNYLYLGVVIGIALINKWDILWLAFPMFLGLIFFPIRKTIYSKEFLIGLFVLIIIPLPYLIWMKNHDFINLTYYLSYNDVQPISLFESFIGSFNIFTLLTIPLWIIGSIDLYLRSKKHSYLKVFLFVIILEWLLVIITKAPSYLSLPIAMVLFAYGISFILFTLKNFKWLQYIGIVYVLVIIFIDLISIPIAKGPYFTLEMTKRLNHIFFRTSTLNIAMQSHVGGKEITQYISQLYQKLENKNQIGIWTNSYFIAAPIAFYHKKYHLPEPISNHQDFFLWANQANLDKHEFIYIGPEKINSTYQTFHQIALSDIFQNVRQIGKINIADAPSYVNQPVWLVSDFKNNQNLSSLWKQLSNMSQEKESTD